MAQLLRSAGYSLPAPATTLAGRQHPDRDGQFRYLNERVKQFLAAGQPVVSVHANKKELAEHAPQPARARSARGQRRVKAG